jgi:aryl-alcohol dehydrogenase-like predicted oxidoreductase
MREFGGTGIRASVVGLGCNNFGLYQSAAQAVAVVRKALDVGINFFDMATFATMEANSSILVCDA